VQRLKRVININKNEIVFLVETAPMLEKLVFAKNNELACNTCIDKNLNEDARQTYGLVNF